MGIRINDPLLAWKNLEFNWGWMDLDHCYIDIPFVMTGIVEPNGWPDGVLEAIAYLCSNE